MKKILISIIALISIFSFSSCNNQDDTSVQEQTDHYAVNETKARNNSDSIAEQSSNIIDDSSTVSSMTMEEIYEYYDLKRTTFNVVKDVNADKVTNMKTISIDGKLITFPTNYETLKKSFELYTEEYQKYVYEKPIDETVEQTVFEVHARPTTGEGTIIFMFTSDTPKKITEMTCKQVILTAVTKENEQLMTIALPDDIVFGCKYENVENKNNNHYESTKTEGWTFVYDTEEYTVKYSGVDGGLYSINITYK